MSVMATTQLDVDLDLVDPNPKNPRFAVTGVDELADSIRAVGLLEPLVLGLGEVTGRGRSRKQRYVLIAGHRRLAACKQAGMAAAPATVREDLDTPAKHLTAALAENGDRHDLSAIEEGAAYEQLEVFGYDPARIAAETGRPKARIEKRRALMRLPEQVREKVHARAITLGDAQVMTEFADDPDAIAALEKVIGTDEFPYELARRRTRRERAKETERELKRLRKAKVWIHESRPNGCTEVIDGRMVAESPCAHHGVYVDQVGEIRHVCTEPDAHKPAPPVRPHNAAAAALDDPDPAGESVGPPAGSGTTTTGDADRDNAGAGADGGDGAAARRAEEDRALLEDLAAASQVRLDWVRELCSPGRRLSRDQQTAMLGAIITQAVRDGWINVFGLGQWIGIDLGDPHVRDQQDATNELQRRLEAADPARLVQVAWAAHLADAVSTPLLAQPKAWPDAAEPVLEHLVELGYKPGAIERRLLAQQDEPDAAAPAQTASETAGGAGASVPA